MANVIEMTVKMYDARGFVQPWLAYVVLVDDEVVGTCAFTAAPDDGRVEIAYYTFPSFEGRGVATAMARELIAIARADGIAVFAHTLPQRARARRRSTSASASRSQEAMTTRRTV